MMLMNELLDETIKSLADDYDKSRAEYDKLAKKLEAIVAKHSALLELKEKVDNIKLAAETIIVKNKEKKNG